jgi:hypothetical protein
MGAPMNVNLDNRENDLARQIVVARERCLGLGHRIDLLVRNGQDASSAEVLLFIYRERLEALTQERATLQKRRMTQLTYEADVHFVLHNPTWRRHSGEAGQLRCQLALVET